MNLFESLNGTFVTEGGQNSIRHCHCRKRRLCEKIWVYKCFSSDFLSEKASYVTQEILSIFKYNNVLPYKRKKNYRYSLFYMQSTYFLLGPWTKLFAH